MSGETESQVSGWTTDTLKAYLEARYHDLRDALNERYETQTRATSAAFDAADKAVRAALASAEKAAALAAESAKDRFEAVNEFRGQLSDVIATFLPRTEYNAAHKALEDQVHTLADRLSALELRLTSRLDLGQSNTEGNARQVVEHREYREEKRTGSALTAQWIALILIAAGLIATILIAVL